jgi:hypothetical protein
MSYTFRVLMYHKLKERVMANVKKEEVKKEAPVISVPVAKDNSALKTEVKFTE